MATLADAQAQLAAWEAASLALASNKSYTIGGRTLTRANSDEVIKMISYWERKVDKLLSGGIRFTGVTPL
jgi:hypothetical protein